MNSTNELNRLWKTLEEKFSQEIKTIFSKQDEQAWLNQFAPQQEIVIHQVAGDDIENRKTIKVFNGKVLSSILKGRLPASMMVKSFFKRLRKQGYSHSEIYLLGIDRKNQDQVNAHVRFERYNQSGIIYESAKVLYSLIRLKDKWYITEVFVYDDSIGTPPEIDLSKMWSPSK